MMAAVSLLAVIIVVEAIPVSEQLRAWQAGEPASPPTSLLVAVAAVFSICAVATVVPLRLGLRRLAELEA